MNNTLYLYDEDGNEIPFEFLDEIDYNGNQYVALRPMEGTGTDEVLILLVEGDNFSLVENQKTLHTVYQLFQEAQKDNYTFRD
ncbi:MAG TPA: DUF1292 domain-containing protein [Clostridiales bacterium]|nr:DUF1292 domain-containing protein [Clostridiales bacterium]